MVADVHRTDIPLNFTFTVFLNDGERTAGDAVRIDQKTGQRNKTLHVDVLEHRRENCDFALIVCLIVIAVDNAQHGIVDADGIVGVDRGHSGSVVKFAVAVEIPIITDNFTFRDSGVGSIKLNLLAFMHRPVGAGDGRKGYSVARTRK